MLSSHGVKVVGMYSSIVQKCDKKQKYFKKEPPEDKNSIFYNYFTIILKKTNHFS